MDLESSTRKWITERHSTFVNGLTEDSKIEDTVIEKLLENAIWAPSHGLLQAWQFKVFAGKGVDSFFRLQQSVYKEIMPPEKYNEIKFRNYPEKSRRVSHVIAIIARRDPKKRYPKQEDIVSVACAVQNIYLSLEAFGIAGYLSTGDTCYADSMRLYLQLGEEDECIGFFILGIADTSAARPVRKRIPAKEKTEWIRD
jgi:nitroreductase